MTTCLYIDLTHQNKLSNLFYKYN